jgi:UDP-GlcNAc:undecaprenyl-phosphate GlcNAc-1-phosphate transferase
VIIAVKLIVFYSTGIYRGFWQYISTRDVFQYARSSFFATLVAITGVTILFRFKDFSIGVFILDWILTTAFLLGTRGSFRLFTETMKRKTLTGEPVVIYGAGRGGELLLREILNNKTLNINPVGFLDDDPLKIGKNIQGFPIRGGLDHLTALRKKYPIRGMLLSFDGKANQKRIKMRSRIVVDTGCF